ncbi:hypothetical protein M426DRAFT_322157 [Hypoxylon sp. CI-4A]|nr:hypothetical protein M426DRAFT_322157 [Hypoxylon sp. CI-4A]
MTAESSSRMQNLPPQSSEPIIAPDSDSKATESRTPAQTNPPRRRGRPRGTGRGSSKGKVQKLKGTAKK